MDLQQQSALDYWFRKLNNASQPTGFSTGNPAGELCSFEYSISPETYAKLQRATNGQEVSELIIVLAAWHILLYRYGIDQPSTAMPPVTFGNIPAPAFTAQKLYFQTPVNITTTFRDIVAALSEQFKAALPQQNYDRRLLDEMWKANNNTGLTSWETLAITHDRLHVQTAPLENIDLAITISGEGPWKCSYRKGILPQQLLQRLPAHLENILQHAFQAPDQPVATCPMLTGDEQATLLSLSGQANTCPPAATGIHHWFETIATQHPEHIALSVGKEQLTYAQLNDEADRLAACLSQEKQVRPGDVIALLVQQDKWAIISLLAILKTGAAYLPVDPEYPAERITYMLQDAKATFLISNVTHHSIGINSLSLIDWSAEKRQPQTLNNNIRVQPDNIAYIIYTSGSTGTPKGVPISHQQVCNLLTALRQVMGFENGLQYILNASFAFDASVKEIFLPLIGQGTLHIGADYRNITEFTSYLQQQRIDVLHASPLYWEELLRAISNTGAQLSLKYVSTGGDVLSPQLAKNIRNQFPQAVFMNLYGPTETTINATGARIDIAGGQQVTIGTPLPGYETFILDRNGVMLPQGLTGELCIAGIGVAAGYLGKEEASAKAFVTYDIAGARKVYRTGDKVKWSENGELEFLGRMDQQVKIRGYRIEPEEIRLALLKNTGVEEAYINVKKGKDEVDGLIAYIRLQEGTSLEQVRASLADQLPTYMLPGKWIAVKAFSRNTAGKIDKDLLPDPDQQEQYIAPETITEQALAEIWQEVLKVEEVGKTDDFFARGGHSLNAIRLLSAVVKQFQVKLELADVFTYPVLEKLAARIDGLENKTIALIPQAARATHYPLAPTQKRLWIIDRLEDGKAPYNIPVAFRIQGTPDQQVLLQSLNLLAAQYEILRTAFIEKEGHPYMWIQDIQEFQLPVHHSHLTGTENETAVNRLCEEEADTAFNLSVPPLWRVRLIHTPQEMIGIITFHHIIADGWSVNIFTETLLFLYKTLLNKTTPHLPALTLQYKDYAVWMNDRMNTVEMAQAGEYWKEKFREEIARLELPADHTRPVVKSHQGSAVYTDIDRALTQKLHTFSRQQEVTPFVVLLAAFRLLLHKYIGQQHIAIGIPVAGREHAGLEEQLGFFINTIPVTPDIFPDDNFIALLQRVKEELLQSYHYQDYPFDQLVEALNLERDSSRSPLFDIMFGSIPASALHTTELTPGITIQPIEIATTSSKYDLLLNVGEQADGYRIYTEFDTALFSKARITQLMEHYLRILELVIDTPGAEVDKCEYLSPAERHQLLHTFTEQKKTYPAYPSLYHLFIDRVAASPAQTALLYNNSEMSYEALAQRVKERAAILVNKGVQPNKPVALFMERSVDVVVNSFAILAVGAYYVPLNPAFPAERIRYILENAGAKMMLTDKTLLPTLESMHLPADISILDMSALPIEQHLTANWQPATGDIAYMIYTSGSTGEPKGVTITHQQVMNTLWAMQDNYPAGKEDNWLFKTNYTFDVSVSELFGWLPGGSKLTILPEGEEKEVYTILDTIDQYNITHISFVPSLFTIFFEIAKEHTTAANKLKYIFVAGEAFPEKLAIDLSRSVWKEKVFNLYGPTEASIYATAFALKDYTAGPVYIGTPLQNVTVYILDQQDHLVPIGNPGELCIGGAGVSNGYWKNPVLTGEKFVNNYFDTGKLYRSGDIARWTNTGNIEYLGRKDEQVKINGHRIEIGEIEKVLGKAPGIKQNAVLARTDRPGHTQLVAYITVADNYDANAINAHLEKWLPAYMIPVAFVQLEALPLNSSGKINRKALPAPQEKLPTASNTYIAPETPEEKLLAELWEQVLHISNPGIHNSFFELGGNSMAAIKLSTLIRSQCNINLAVKDIFRLPTIAKLAVQLKQADARPIPVIPKMADLSGNGHLPLSFAQERFWLLDKWGQGAAYNLPVALTLKGELNRNALENAISNVIQRHTVLRTLIREQSGKPFQLITDAAQWQLTYRTQESIGDDKALAQFIRECIDKEFDLAHELPLRGVLIQQNSTTHILLLTFHHIAMDIWSIYLVGEELGKWYNAACQHTTATLDTLPVQYADYAAWQRTHFNASLLADRIQYWVNKLDNVTPLQLPADYIRTGTAASDGGSYRFVIDRETADGIRAMAARYNVTLFISLLSVFKVLLHRYTNKEDITVGVPVANRELPEIHPLVGCFINTIVLRSYLSSGMPFSQLLQQLADTAVEGYAYQDVPFEMILDRLPSDGDHSRNAAFEVMFDLQDMPAAQPLALQDITIEEYPFERAAALFDLCFSLTSDNSNGTIILNAEYSTELFHQDSIRRMADHYLMLLQAALSNEQQPVGKMKMLTDAEWNKLQAFSGKAKQYPGAITVLDLFNEQVRNIPGQPAIIFKETTLTYLQLEEQANRLAHHLLEKGIQRETPVAVFMNRSQDVIVAILAILKAGAAYVPVEPIYPPARVAYMLSDAGVNIIITDAACKEDIAAPDNFKLICLDDNREWLYTYPPTPVPTIVAPQQLAYIIYTSGSTGQPKGVMVEHGSLLNMNLNWRDHYQLDLIKPVLLSIASIAFDVFTGDWCRTLTNGGKMIITDNSNFDMQEFYDIMKEHRVNILESTPAVIMSLLRHIDQQTLDYSFLKILIVGSDIMPAEQYTYLRKKYGKDMRVINSYGVTETTIDASCFESDTEQVGVTPIGQPMKNIYFYILDEHLQPVPINVWGELYIGGLGVARGYRNKEALTVERFLDNPFNDLGHKMYKTGDVARWLPDGNVSFFGRKDDQVKIRGFRIELPEIENVLLQHPQIANALVTVQQDPDYPAEKFLCAYYVPAKHTGIAPALTALRDFLQDKLPYYMIPQYFMELETIPLTVNGKVDKKALPPPHTTNAMTERETEPPANEIEAALVEIWKEAFKTLPFGVTDNFFVIGGNSLKAVHILALINEHFFTDIKMKVFIANPVIRELSQHIISFYEEQKDLFAAALEENENEQQNLN